MFLDVFSFIYVHQLHFQFVLNVNSQIDKYTYDADDEISCELTLKVRPGTIYSKIDLSGKTCTPTDIMLYAFHLSK